MKEFLFVFRNDYKAVPPGSPEEMQAVMKQWMDWIGGIAAQNKLADKGNRLGSEGKVVRANNIITDGPYTEIKELIGGYIAVKADSFEEASEMAKGCPIFNTGGNLEIREIIPM
ncbi:MAG: transcription initiation protein [Chitinophagaceae bacterium]|nr:transcription initiation protein [Chitinophagaceae bacterium]